jgi:phage FluMu protein Com
MSDSNDICAHCGAPRAAGYGACKFCGTVFARAQQTTTQENAIPCPRCRTVNEWGAQKCVQCQAWVVVQCLFCSSLSPQHLPACLRCHEAFAGAPERFQQRQAQQQGQQRMAVMGTVGNVAASFLGAAAGMAVGGAWSGQGYRHEGYPHHGYQGHHRSFDSDGYRSESRDDGGLFGSGGGESSGQGNWDTSSAGGSGGGLMDSLFSGGDSGGDSGGSSDSTGDAGGDGGGLMDSLFSGGGGSDDS